MSVPYYMSHTAWSNPEHQRGFNYTTFKYFIKGTEEEVNHNIGIAFSSGKIRFTYGRGKNPFNYFMSPIANKFPNVFEKSFLKSLFHADGIEAILIK